VIDDDGLARRSLAALLAAAQFSVRTHESAIAFLTDLPEIEFGCIVTDLYMPSVDGIELIGYLRACGASTPVIVLSGRGEVPLAVKAMRAGAIEFLEKPVEADELIAWVRSALVYQNAAPTYVSPG
jgi:two-component system response regulator FixJ